MKHFFRGLLLLGAFAAIYGQCMAQGLTLSATTGFPNNAIIYSCPVTLVIGGTPPAGTQIIGVRWRNRQTGPGCQTAFSEWVGGSVTRTYQTPRVGDFEIQAEVSCRAQPNQQIPNPPTTLVVLTKSITVPLPNGILLPSPSVVVLVPYLPIDNPPSGSVALFQFPITCNGNLICTGTSIKKVKENVTNQFFLGEEVGDQLEVGDADKLYLSSTSIFDKKRYAANVDPNTLGVVHSYDQELLIYIDDACGTEHRSTLGPKVHVTVETFRDTDGVLKYKISVTQAP